MAVRAIRGATCLISDDMEQMLSAVPELLEQMMKRNDLVAEDFISLLFTSTPDLVCGFPAAAARHAGFRKVPLMCAQEIDVAGALPKVVRVMAHVESARSLDEVEHVFLRGAQVLREDLTR